MTRYRPLFIVSLLIFGFAVGGLMRLKIDTDVIRSLPTGDKVLSDSFDFFEHHPIHDQVAVDITLSNDDLELLVECGNYLKREMEESGLFRRVGLDPVGERIQELAVYTALNLPILFSSKELIQHVDPLLNESHIGTLLEQHYTELSTMSGIGLAQFIKSDPLGLKDLVLAKLAPLSPSQDFTIYKNNLLSADRHHLLVVAKPLKAATDTASARKIDDLIAHSTQSLSKKYITSGQQVIFTPVGAYRAALDNERIIRHDVSLALGLATCGIALLLLISFPRPLIGLLAFLPALAGSAAALFTYSLFHSTISIMVLGFGGALISITVDHGISYLLFLDRPHETKGKDASREVKAIGIMAVITSVGAFVVLSISGFPLFTQLGQFTALGILFSFLFVHSVLPWLFPVMPSGSKRTLPLRELVNKLCLPRKSAVAATLLFAAGMLFFARPQFHVELSSMNTLTDETIAAEEQFSEVWGNGRNRVFIMNSADSIEEIQSENDRILEKLEHDVEQAVLEAAFVPSMVYPGSTRLSENFTDWKEFWDNNRVNGVRRLLTRSGSRLGFAPDAFSDFLTQLEPSYTPPSPGIPARFYNLLGITQNDTGPKLSQFITALPGSGYDAQTFVERYNKGLNVFDAAFFSERLADILYSTFVTILAIVAVSLVILLLVFYLDIGLTLLTLLPIAFAYVCTLGTLNIIGRPLDIPSLMLSVVILGMGIDYSIFFVRAHQRYRDIDHPYYTLARSGIFLAATSTLIGFGALIYARHTMLNSIGVTSFFGIGYSLIGTVFLLPFLLNLYFNRKDKKRSRQKGDISRRIMSHYKTLEAHPRLFANFKLRTDPMFRDLPDMLAIRNEIKTIIDIGCGFGVPACWCLESYPQARVYGIDPDPEKVRVASIAIGHLGKMSQDRAPSLPAIGTPADLVLLLDMLHFLDDQTVRAVLTNSLEALQPGGIIVARFVTVPAKGPSWLCRLENKKVRLHGGTLWYRTAKEMDRLLTEAGFETMLNRISATNEELVWIVGQVPMNSYLELSCSARKCPEFQ